MIKIFGRIATVVAVLGLLAPPASAQHENAWWPALPGTGVMVGGDVGLALSDDAKIGGETPLYVGGRVQVGLPMFGVWAAAGMAPLGVEGVDSEITFAGGLGYHVLNAPMMPVTVSIQAAATYIQDLVTFGGGPLLVINVPSTGVEVQPFIYPRVEYVKISDVDGEIGFGGSGGLNVNLPMGVGFHAAIDFLSVGFGDSDRESQLRAAAGVHYNIQVPSLGM